MYVVGFLNSKGGVGKSTLCSAIAVRAAKDSKRVALVDLDPQRSIAEWHERRGSPDNPTLFTGEDRASDAVEALELNGYDWVFLDGPPGSLTVTEDAIRVSDFVVVPMRASGLDIIASQSCIHLCEEAGVSHFVAINFARSKDDKLVSELRTTLAGEIPVAQTAITQRVAYVTAMTKGATAGEKNGPEKEEVDALWREIKSATLKAAKAKRAAQ